jgi:hypothetical protein
MDQAGLLFSLADVRCEHCQTKFRLQDFKSTHSLVCSSCGQSVEFFDKAGVPHLGFDPNLVRPSEAVHIRREGSIFIIEKRWLSKLSRLLVILAGLWNGVWITGFLGLKNGWIESLPFEYDSWILISMIGTGLALAFLALRSILNKTRIMVKNSKLVVSDSPLSWGNLMIFDIQDIQGTSLWRKDPKSDLPLFSFSVNLHLKDGRTVRLCRAQNCNEAAYIEKTLEEILIIEKTPRVVDPLVS